MTLARLNFDQSWAGNVPARWRWSRNKEFLAESLTVSLDGTEELLSVSHLTGITPKSEKNVTMTAAENLEGYRLVCPGDRTPRPESTTAHVPRQRVELCQALSRQPPLSRGLAAVSPRLRQRDLPADPARAHEDRVPAAALGVENLQPLALQRMKRVSDDYETRRITGRPGIMPWPSECRASWFPHHAPSGFPPP